jgi:hypothetical protein
VAVDASSVRRAANSEWRVASSEWRMVGADPCVCHVVGADHRVCPKMGALKSSARFWTGKRGNAEWRFVALSAERK